MRHKPIHNLRYNIMYLVYNAHIELCDVKFVYGLHAFVVNITSNYNERI